MSVVGLEMVVIAYGGDPVAVPLVRQLEGKPGLTIGRNPSNDMVLDDPARQVSRFQAKISKTGQGAELSNVSSQSSVLINGTEVRPGATAKVDVGDKIVMGRYLLELRASQTSASLPPDDQQPADAVNPWDIPEAPEPEPTSTGSGLGQIPDDYDVFALPVSAPTEATETQVQSLGDFAEIESKALLQGLEPLQLDSSDSLLHEQKPEKGAVLELMDEKLDPMKLFGGSTSEVMHETLGLDHGAEIHGIINLPPSREIDAKQPPEAINPPPEKVIVESIEDAQPMGDASLASLLEDQAPPPPTTENEPPAEQIPAPTREPIKQDKTSSANQSDAMRLALAQGCGLPEETLPELTPELMHDLGMILRALSDGTVRLMHSRSITKHEMRANVTIIASAGNNPLKFAPDGTSALQQLLGKRFSGFMPPIEAIEDAFDDLSAHQLGLLAGARTAASDLVEKLSPEKTVANVEEPGMLEQLIPVVKEAKMWRRHKLRYKEIADDKEGFAALIEKAFVRSYEDEIERIYSGRGQ